MIRTLMNIHTPLTVRSVVRDLVAGGLWLVCWSLTFVLMQPDKANGQDAVAPPTTAPISAVPASTTPVTATPPPTTPPASNFPTVAVPSAAVKVNTAAVEVAPIKLTVELDGVIDSPGKAIVALRPKSLKELKVIGAIGHGSRVSQGQVVLQLESDAWERARRIAEQAAVSAEQDAKLATAALTLLEESLRIELESADLANDRAQEELEYFLTVGRELQEDDLNYSLLASEQSVEYAREEYEQLKKMYDADELTEESEEIVLKRALNDLKRSERYFAQTQRRVKRQLEVELDRQQAGLKNTAAKAKLDLEKLQKSQEGKTVAAKLAVARAEAALELARKEVANINEDRGQLVAAAPFAGVVLWGGMTNSGWKGISSVEDSLYVGAMVQPNRPLLTVISTDKLFIRASVTEKQIGSIKPGMSAHFEPTARPESRIEVVCEERGDVPIEPGSYRVAFRVVRPTELDGLLPLMTGKLTGSTYEKEKAILIPQEAVRFEGQTTYVLLHDSSSGKSTRQDVLLGRRDGKRVEVTQGVREGEHVVLP